MNFHKKFEPLEQDMSCLFICYFLVRNNLIGYEIRENLVFVVLEVTNDQLTTCFHQFLNVVST